jgi:hypothetical protein
VVHTINAEGRVAADPEFLESPYDRVTRLIRAATNPESSEASREQAAREIASTAPEDLRILALDGDWRFLLSVFANDPSAGDYAGDGFWSVNAQWEGDEHMRAQSPPQPPAFQMELHCESLRLLLVDDLHEARLARYRPTEPRSAERRILLASSARTEAPEPTVRYARRLAWSLVEPGAGLEHVIEQSGGDDRLIIAFVDEVLRREAHLGIPPRLARALLRVIRRRTDAQDWTTGVLESMDALAATRMIDGMSQESLEELYLEMRIDVARRARTAEISDARLLAAAEVYAGVRLLKQAAMLDLRRAWNETRAAGGTPRDAANLYQVMDYQQQHMTARALPALYSQPRPRVIARLAASDRDVLGFAGAIRRRDPDGAKQMLLRA